MQQSHPVFGNLVVRDACYPGARWMIHDAPVSLDEVLHLIDSGWSTEDILERHMLILRADLVEITMLHAFAG